jgi:hypothetical protein
VDVVVVSAGFTAEQMGDFHAVCERLTKALFTVEPWARYKSLINVHTVFVGDESLDVSRLKVSGYKGHVLSCDNGIAVEYARYAANAAAILVIHNSATPLQSPGSISWVPACMCRVMASARISVSCQAAGAGV